MDIKKSFSLITDFKSKSILLYKCFYHTAKIQTEKFTGLGMNVSALLTDYPKKHFFLECKIPSKF